MQVPPLTACMILTMFFKLFEPQFPHLKSEGNVCHLYQGDKAEKILNSKSPVDISDSLLSQLLLSFMLKSPSLLTTTFDLQDVMLCSCLGLLSHSY